MYQIIGADGQEYGPITVEQLRQWISEGRVNTQTRVKAPGAATWQPLGALPEFASAVATLSAPPPRTSGLAITSLVLGIVGFCGITAMAGLILGIIALASIKKSRGQLTGKGLATAGIVVSLLMLIGLIGISFPLYRAGKRKVDMVQCLAHAQQLNMAMLTYHSSNTNHLPPAATWCNAIQSYTDSEAFRCPSGDPTKNCHFAFNTNMDNVDVTKMTNYSAVLFFESDGGWNASGGPELMKSRHEGRIIIGFTDGHVEFLKTNELNKLRWTP